MSNYAQAVINFEECRLAYVAARAQLETQYMEAVYFPYTRRLLDSLYTNVSLSYHAAAAWGMRALALDDFDELAQFTADYQRDLLLPRLQRWCDGLDPFPEPTK